ncbi:putative H/ACA ribonucleoprotein complex subunit 1-like protein [Caenorhabditis elegans]|uniref:Probable H/ACA ribonucleoprotein complex subunit 1-like protein n=1 Tax=Caenorhabditis elegans TaxID=6239 RepID=GAR1_CAEEL|nr:putative H/ACA ribonucleoprotein complex subunit 1-like protein [Caenorhabditis elegans]Q9TYK1.2 RecName: Full=Probable H/ACA ribonucleoprotein complex subunit 1-like protein [Caenorhabditis elegans]CCD73147.1 Probable H/ACA ribonucleoprotein complex subunit 1-like protein [Caenorhabditis elegans]|eukprot:NP_499927.2 Probable H/ACA ribonucleoprotein complex subunit 1-like protein [Caenorhabditis elegans]
MSFRGGRGGGGGFRGGRGGGGGGGFRGGRGGDRGGGFRGGRGGFGGGGRGGYDQGPPEEVVLVGVFSHQCQDDIVCNNTSGKIPYFNAPIYFKNKEQVGKIDEIFGSPGENGFSVTLSQGVKASSFEPESQLYIDPGKLLPVDRFLPQAGGGRGRGGRGRGGDRGGRGSDRGGRGGFGRGGGGGFRGGDRGGFGGGRGGFRGGDRGGFRGGRGGDFGGRGRGDFKRSYDGGSFGGQNNKRTKFE